MSQRHLHLRRAGVSLVLDLGPDHAQDQDQDPAAADGSRPTVLHWGADLGDLDDEDLAALGTLTAPGVPHSALDHPRRRGLLTETVSGDTGLPALEGWRPAGGAAAWAPRLRDWTLGEVHDEPDGDAVVRLSALDAEAGWDVAVDLELTVEGLVRVRTSVTNAGPGELVLAAVRTALPVGSHATELLDLTGRWCRERSPQRRAWLHGTHLREGRHGRTGHDATLLLAAGTPGFGFGHGEVWATHVAWSGDHAAYAERTPEGECVLGGGELLGPGEVRLAPGASYAGPWVLGAWSGAGLDPAGHRLTSWLRRQARATGPRKVLVNTWEATYFDHRLERLAALADAAAEVGVERFVLDDGWFRGRRDDRAGLGDWTVDAAVWPQGLHPLVEHVHALGMDLGLWVEPEMVNVDSDLVREHPDWVLRGRGALPAEWRHQQVLDLQVPGAYAHVRDALLALLDEHDIAFLKWDHNRDLVDVSHDGRPAVHGQTVAFYRLLDELRVAHPDLEIETCASGGGRVDAEVLTRTDRVWPSDTIDAIERQRIQRWTGLLVPPEMIGSHIGGPVAHTTGRTLGLGLRAATALLGHLGIEWDLTTATPEERAEVAAWVALHKQARDVVATGRVVHGDVEDAALSLTGVVGEGATEAWYVVAVVETVTTQSPPPVRLPGLDPAPRYRVVDRTPGGPRHPSDMGTSWLDASRGAGGVVVLGSVLGGVGLGLPVLAPGTALALQVTAVGADLLTDLGAG